ncbi:hypothetical protein KVT40_006399 [Elsinoe batatas]|uniref:Uncharacterized protein n=1 Tax=Elsinoe batatas TaxID=2601811 RepID=A0A8K0L0J4_9PEZI|nr:hypothetical protein KVT40_006399 [Elsinoe batatas]
MQPVQPDPYMLVTGVAVAVFTPYTYCIFKYGQYVIDTAQELWAEIFDFQLGEEHYQWMFDDKPDVESDEVSRIVGQDCHGMERGCISNGQRSIEQSAATITTSNAIVESGESRADDESSDTSSPKKNIKPDTTWAADVYPLAAGDKSPTQRDPVDEQPKERHPSAGKNEDYEKLSLGSDHDSTDEEWEKSWWTNKPLRRV